MGRSEWSLLVNSPGEALRAIQANTKGKLYPYFTDKANEGIQYAIKINDKPLEEEADLLVSRSSLRSLDIMPVPAGSGGLGKLLIGITLIIVAIVITVVTYGAAASLGVTLAHLGASIALSVGLSLALGGISEMMSNSPKLGTNSRIARETKDDSSKNADKKSSYLFSGVSNTTRQGNCVPMGYGRHRVGSQVISFGITRTKIDFDNNQPVTIPLNDDDIFFTSPGWATLEASDFATALNSVSYIRHLNAQQVRDLANYMSIIGPTVPSGNTHPAATVAQMRSALYILSLLFNGPHQSLTVEKLDAIYRIWLGLTTLPPQVRKYRFDQYVEAVGTFYIPDIVW